MKATRQEAGSRKQAAHHHPATFIPRPMIKSKSITVVQLKITSTSMHNADRQQACLERPRNVNLFKDRITALFIPQYQVPGAHTRIAGYHSIRIPIGHITAQFYVRSSTAI